MTENPNVREIPLAVRAAVARHTSALLTLPNVHGVGTSFRRRGGAVTDEPVIVVYVTQKIPLDALAADAVIPRELDSDEEVVATDVVESSPQRLTAVDTAQYRPVAGGCQIATVSGTGTLGAVLFDRTDHQPVFLTCNHVLTTADNPTYLPSYTVVTQPAAGPQVGTSKRIVPMIRGPLGSSYTFEADVDAGVIAPASTVDLDFSVVELGRHPFVVLPPAEGMTVAFRGYRSQRREGTVEALDVTHLVNAGAGIRYKIGGPGIGFVIRAPELHVSAMSGDSGALVVDGEGAASRGLVFASDERSGGVTLACSLLAVMAALNLEIPCEGALNRLIRLSVVRRFPHLWSGSSGSGSSGSGLVADPPLVGEMVEKMARFRRRYLTGEGGKVANAVASLLDAITVEFAIALQQDDDLNGLLDRALGDWFVLPSVYDMLEYRVPVSFADHALAAIDRLLELRPGLDGPDWVRGVIRFAPGHTVRELLGIERDAGHQASS